MVLRRRLELPKDLFPTDPWRLVTRSYRGELVQEAETLFALGNGFMGLRGSHEEDHPVGEPGSYVNGFHELRPIVYGEEAYGFPKTGQTMLNCPDGKIIKFYVDDEPFDLDAKEVRDYRRVLDMGRAVLEREFVWVSPNGRTIKLKTTRLVSLSHRHLAAFHWQFVAEDGDCDLTISSQMINRQASQIEVDDPRIVCPFDQHVLQGRGHDGTRTRAVFAYQAPMSKMMLGCGIEHVLETACDHTIVPRIDPHDADFVFRIRAEAGKPVTLTKFIAYHASRHRTSEELRAQTAWTLDSAVSNGFADVLRQHEAAAATFWEHANIVVEDGVERQRMIRWNLFQLLQASACVDGTGIGARGLTGRTYEGHYFWDTEIYVLPFLIYTNPRAARGLLKFRYDKLDKARKWARTLGHRGCLFPWRTINGDEASAYFAASTAQYHINADIAYAIRKYVEITGDDDFLLDYGAEILVETARLWTDLGHFDPRRGGRFCIDGVTGPDEYTAIVNNNYFTNIMARENLWYAVETMTRMRRDHAEAFEAVRRLTGLDDHEVAVWQQAADRMFLPFDDSLGIHPQDDSFLHKRRWDFERTPEDTYPLLLHYHPLNLYRSQVIKQADTLLAMFLLAHEFSGAEMKRNFDYYDPLTTHDSSLSVCIQSIIANSVGYSEKALEYFDFAAAMDLSDVGGNVKHGAHIASIGGSWLALVYGFAGMRDFAGRISFRPRPPESWRGLRFRLLVRGSQIEVEANAQATTYRLLSGPAFVFRHLGVQLSLDDTCREITRANEVPLAQSAAG